MFQLTSLQWKSFFRSAALAGNLFSKIMTWFWIGTVIPLLLLFLLSFTQGDVSLYGNWWERASQEGLAATATMYDQSMVEQGYKGMIAVSVGLILASGLLWNCLLYTSPSPRD